MPSIKATPEVAAALTKYIDLRQQKKHIEDQMVEPRKTVEQFMGNNDTLLSTDGLCKIASWSYNKPKTVIDLNGVVEELRAMYQIPDDVIAHVKNEYTIQEPGARKFCV
jgi:hypothetical protein